MDGAPVTEKETLRGSSDSHKETSSSREEWNFRFGASAMQGCRPNMEDRMICKLELDEDLPHHGLFCVLDGHGGTEAAEFASNELPRLICDTRHWQEYTEIVTPFVYDDTSRPSQEEIDKWTSFLEQALQQGFCELDRELYLKLNQVPNKLRETPGSTGVAVLVTPFSLVCANIGDSRCVLATKQKSTITPLPLSIDHTPELPIERKRIERAGGSVSCGRVEGELAVSRAFGDFEFKQVAKLQQLDDYDPNDADDVRNLIGRAKAQKVSPFPEIIVHPRNNDNAGDDNCFVVLACDGVWDVVSNEECVEFIATMLQHQSQEDLGAICEAMLDVCLEQGSEDNMTMILVLLEAGEKMIGARKGHYSTRSKTSGGIKKKKR